MKENKINDFSLAEEAFERNFPKFGLDLIEKSEDAASLAKQLNTGLNPKTLVKKMRDDYEASLSLLTYVDSKRNSSQTALLADYKGGFEKYFASRNSQYAPVAIRANSPAIVPAFNQRGLTETSGAALVGSIVRSDLAELPNIIPTLNKIGVTFNFVSGTEAKQVIPSVVLNSPVADIKDNIIIGSLTDPEFSLDEHEVYLIVSQLPLSRKFFIQISDTTNELLKQIIFNVIQDALMYRVFYGAIADGQCEGLYNKSTIEKVSGASLDELKAYELMRKVHANSAPVENCVWVLNAALEEKLKARPYANNGDRRVIEKGLLFDKPYALSERITNGQLWYGAFQSIVLTMYDFEFRIDPFSSEGVIMLQWQPYSMSVRNAGWIKCFTGVN